MEKFVILSKQNLKNGVTALLNKYPKSPESAYTAWIHQKGKRILINIEAFDGFEDWCVLVKENGSWYFEKEFRNYIAARGYTTLTSGLIGLPLRHWNGKSRSGITLESVVKRVNAILSDPLF